MTRDISTSDGSVATVEAAWNAELELTDRELTVLRVTDGNSLSTLAIAAHLGMERDVSLVTPILERLEQLQLLDGFYAAGRTMRSAAEIHRRYYRSSEQGRRVTGALA